MSKDRRRFSDLTRQEKVWVVVGMVEVFFTLAVGFLWYQFFMVGDAPPFHIVGLMNAGKLFAGARMVVSTMFLFAVIPTVVLFGAIMCYFMHQSASHAFKLIVSVLTLAGASSTSSVALLPFLDLFFSTAPIAIQTVLMVLSMLSVLAVFVRMLKFKKIQELLMFL